ncbi:MAG: hypothetical protein K5647_08025 [Clostridiales bacterium]|nr:hypothetical protein [Clostridiales bacterium]
MRNDPKNTIPAALILLLSLLAAVFLPACGRTGDPDATGTGTGAESTAAAPDTGEILLYEKGSDANYRVVRADQCDKWLTDAAASVRRRLESEFGAKLDIVTDYEGRGGFERNSGEIVVGRTNRSDEIGYPDPDEYGWGGYSVFVSDGRVVIDASGEEGMTAGIEAFFAALSVTRGADGETEKITLSGGTDIMISNKAEPDEIFDIENRKDLVAICYSTWFDPIMDQSGDDPANVTEVLEGKRDWGAEGEFHYWGKPALGYYRSTDRDVIRQHMIMLKEAGIDFIILDNTNAVTAWKNIKYTDKTTGKQKIYWDAMVKEPCIAMMETLYEMTEEGLEVPYVVNWCGTPVDYSTIDKLYEEVYASGKYDRLWVYWGGKPFFLCTEWKGERDDIKVKMMWGLRGNMNAGEWSFLNYPNIVSRAADGSAEQVCVCVAVQQGYMSDPGAIGRRGGLTFWEQWRTAFDARPKVVTITWWNEWAAQRFIVDGKTKFVDNYNREYSRDIEPMEGGHGDLYYRWMKQYIEAYKSGAACPKLVEN